MQNQPVEPACECGGIFRQLAVEDLRLLQQQERQIGRGILRLGDGGDQRMTHVDLEDRLGAHALVLLRQQPFQLAIPAKPARDKA